MKFDDMNNARGFRMLLQVQIGKTLRTDQMSLTTRVAGREVMIREVAREI